MRVTIKQHHLNLRQSKPSVNAQVVRTLVPGEEIEIDGQLYRGEKFEGVDTWLKDDAGNYCWSEGTNYLDVQTILPEVQNFTSLKFNYNQLITLDSKYKQTKGEGVVVAIVDTGCGVHRDLEDAIVNKHNAITNSDEAPDRSLESHGTFIAGIIAARHGNENEILGIAPKSKLIIVKAVEDSEVDAPNVLSALTWLNELNTPPDIINISLSFDPSNLLQKFSDVISSLSSKGVILVAAGQNNKAIFSGTVFFPARSKDVLGIGAVARQDISGNAINSEIDFILPDREFLSLRRFGNLYTTLNGCSISSAVASGALALITAHLKKNPQGQNAATILSNSVASLSLSNFDDSLKIYKR